MKILSVFLIIIFCFFIGKLNKKSFQISFIFSIAIIFTPVFILSKINKQTFCFFLFSCIFLILLDVIKNRFLKKILFLLMSVYYCLIILYLSGIINNKLEIDFQKLFFINDSSFEIIKRFQSNALYLPKLLRPLIFNYFQIFFVLLVKSLSYVWIDKIIVYLGFSFIYFAFLSFSNTRKSNKNYLFIPIIIFIIGNLHRDPNGQLLFLFSIPSISAFFIKNVQKINISFTVITILISCLYTFL